MRQVARLTLRPCQRGVRALCAVDNPFGLRTKLGDGDSPSASDTVEVHYEGRLIDGTVFDSSYARGETVSFPLGARITMSTHSQSSIGRCSVVPHSLGTGCPATVLAE